MKKMDKFLIAMKNRIQSTVNEFVDSEQGDTNFISMLLIIGVVVVLAGLFLTLGEDVMDTITNKINEFIDSL